MKDHEECYALRKQLMSYIDGDLDTMGCDELEAHIENCVDCQINLETLRKTIEICKKTRGDYQLSEEMTIRLYQCLDMEEYL